jgi:hypothetical protein
MQTNEGGPGAPFPKTFGDFFLYKIRRRSSIEKSDRLASSRQNFALRDRRIS